MLTLLCLVTSVDVEPPYYQSERGPDLKEYVYTHNMPLLIKNAKKILASEESKQLFDRLLDQMMEVPDRDLARHSVVDHDVALKFLYAPAELGT